jgi:hypothetical protein
MALVSIPARDASLAMSYGAARHPSLSLDTLEVALYAGDPAGDGVELDVVGGYAAVLAPNDGTTWPDAPADGQVVSAAVVFPTSTGEWTVGGVPAVADHWAIRDPDTGDLWDAMPLPGAGVSIEIPGVVVQVQLIVPYADPTEA